MNGIYSANTKHFIAFVQPWPNVFDVGPTLYKCYKNVFRLIYMQITPATYLLHRVTSPSRHHTTNTMALYRPLVGYPVNTKRWPKFYLMLARRLRRRANINWVIDRLAFVV